MAATIDMNFQSDLMAIFEENIFWGGDKDEEWKKKKSSPPQHKKSEWKSNFLRGTTKRRPHYRHRPDAMSAGFLPFRLRLQAGCGGRRHTNNNLNSKALIIYWHKTGARLFLEVKRTRPAPFFFLMFVVCERKTWSSGVGCGGGGASTL